MLPSSLKALAALECTRRDLLDFDKALLRKVDNARYYPGGRDH